MKKNLLKIILSMIALLAVFSNAIFATGFGPGIEPYNIYVTLNQAEFHPDETSLFGIKSDSMPICEVNVDENDYKRKNHMALSFDSAYINDFTYRILDILDQYNVKATFFMTYGFIKENPDQVIEIIKRGHEIGNHSTTHPKFTEINDEKIVNEVVKCHELVKNLTGVNMCLFRFPYGSYSAHAVTFLKNMGYYPIQWTFDSLDWKNEPIEILLKRISNSKKIKEGSILLFHNGASFTPDALPAILEYFKTLNLIPCRVSDLIYQHNFYIDKGLQISIPNGK